ncbi:MAG: response regulator transcription factor [Elusimicrobiales bacterium]
MNKRLILVVEDDPAICRLIAQTLEKEGYRARKAKTIGEARDSVRNSRPDMIILDRRLPDGDGLELCRALKTGSDALPAPILFLTSKNSTSDKVVGLKMGADDYLTKPFELDEMLARVEALMRRSGPREQSDRHEYAGIALDAEQHQCIVDGKWVRLWPKEFELLKLFLSKPGKVLSKEHICRRIWGHDFIDTSRAVEMSVRRLRARLGPGGWMIKTVKGYGFMLSSEKESG